MQIHRFRAALSTFALGAVLLVPARSAADNQESVPVIDIGKLAVVMQGGQLRVSIQAGCGGRWEVTRATVYVVQHGDQSAEASIPVECGPSAQRRYDVNVPAIKSGFQAGQAEATATLTLMNTDSGQTTTIEDTSNIVVRTPVVQQSPDR
jgi:hypothetical protein